jgi:hypothetical protein
MNLVPGVWIRGRLAPPRRCVHVDRRLGIACRELFTPAPSEPHNLRRCPKHRNKNRGMKNL